MKGPAECLCFKNLCIVVLASLRSLLLMSESVLHSSVPPLLDVGAGAYFICLMSRSFSFSQPKIIV